MIRMDHLTPDHLKTVIHRKEMMIITMEAMFTAMKKVLFSVKI